MSKSTDKGKKKYADTYKWTDDEVEVLLTVTKDYETKQIAKCINWESCVDKYGEILQAYNAEYPSPDNANAIGKDFSHKKDELTKSVLTSKLKAIRTKYRQSVDDRRRSAHGRVVMIFYEHCSDMWGGSPATSALSDGLESTDGIEIDGNPVTPSLTTDQDGANQFDDNAIDIPDESDIQQTQVS